MAEQNPTGKRLLISKANSRIVAITSGAAFIVVFCLMASYTLVGQLNYQNRVIGAKKKALTQLKQDIDSTADLVTKYKAFVSTPENAIGGDPAGAGPQDGDNAKIVLDALPSKYDFPSLATSLEKILKDQGVRIESISGSDDEVAQTNSASSTPQPVEVPFELSVSGKYANIQKVVKAFENSIRPIQIQTIQVTGNEGEMTLRIVAKTYYQPEKTLNIRTEVVK
ncbi:hypothetical protein BH09PAT4_BH09PAT4_08230 [soil metagenome]|jgi:hypothetical protein